MTKLFITLYAIQLTCNMICWACLVHRHKPKHICDSCTHLKEKTSAGYYYCALKSLEISTHTRYPPKICRDYTTEPLRPTMKE